MKLPWSAGRVLQRNEFEAYHGQVIHDCRNTTIRPEEHLPLIDFPLLMKPGQWPRLAALTEKMAREAAAAEMELLGRPELFHSLGLEERIAKVLKNCERGRRSKSVARVMRFDFCYTKDGWRFTEANPDAPGGHLEAVGLTGGMAPYYPNFLAPPNPAAAYADGVRRSVGEGGVVAFFHSQQRSLAWLGQFVRGEFEKRGLKGMPVDPRRLIWAKNRAEIDGTAGRIKPSAVIRLVQARWLPSLPERARWMPWFCGSQTPLSNPGNTILLESKRFPVIQRELNTLMPTYRAFSPESRSPDDVPERNQDEWVFKPAFGSGGRNIGMSGANNKRDFRRIADRARHEKNAWVAQRRFETVPVATERGPGYVCLGVYTVDGVAAGAFGRIKGKPLIDERAMSIPVLIPECDSTSMKRNQAHSR